MRGRASSRALSPGWQNSGELSDRGLANKDVDTLFQLTVFSVRDLQMHGFVRSSGPFLGPIPV